MNGVTALDYGLNILLVSTLSVTVDG